MTGWSIRFYKAADGHSPVEQFLDALPIHEQAGAKRVLQLLSEYGLLLPSTHAKALTGHRKLWELRAGANRMLYFAVTGRALIILHGFRKRSMKTPAQEIATAERRMSDYLARTRSDNR
ncbi:MAG: type II toxin-antitoxin system RelE/ParE family toxin [Chloroflexota bacterium]|nr:type II toxin-antitoxin system RelE/ParE family toxin [Chloroflexota bacterium]